MSALWPGVVAASLLGSLHCAGMCGPLVASCAVPGGRPVAATAAFSLGRLAAYAVLGALAGAIGSAFDSVGRAAGFSHVAALVAGLGLVAWGASALLASAGWAPWKRRRKEAGTEPESRPARRPWPARLAARMTRPFVGRGPIARGAGLGLAAALLPCGWLHAFTLTAAGTGNALAGSAVLAAFWIGTVPATAGVGLAAARLSEPVRRRIPVFSAALVLALGLVALFGRGGPTVRALVAGDDAPVASCHEEP